MQKLVEFSIQPGSSKLTEIEIVDFGQIDFVFVGVYSVKRLYLSYERFLE